MIHPTSSLWSIREPLRIRIITRADKDLQLSPAPSKPSISIRHPIPMLEGQLTRPSVVEVLFMDATRGDPRWAVVVHNVDIVALKEIRGCPMQVRNTVLFDPR